MSLVEAADSVVWRFVAHLRFWERARVRFTARLACHAIARPEIFARDGVSLETSTVSGWVGATAAAVLQPLVGALAAALLGGEFAYR